MNAIELARQAYAPSTASIRTPRSIEAQLVSEITSRLSKADASYSQRVSAVHDNRAMWTALAVDVADAENTLPQELRANIFYLAEFTEHHSQRYLRGEVGLDALIDVNRAIIRGLRASGGAT